MPEAPKLGDLTEKDLTEIVKEAYWDIIKGPAFKDHVMKIVREGLAKGA